MNVPINILVQSILQKESLEQCSVQELQQLAGQYPYFNVAQLLLTKKLSAGPGGHAENSAQYEEQLQRTFLFFQNPLWLEHLLSNAGNGATIEAGSLDPIPAGTAEEAPGSELEPNEISERKLEEPLFEIPSMKIEPIDPARTELSFEPYYTVDYFASQGIKFNNEEAPKDKFGQQLKSFTEWLKAMKRLPLSEIVETVEKNAGQQVEQLAQYSIEDREVITEAMAEVWKKQGNMAKAIDVYRKLSLLDPSKSHYFAAKIDLLKKIN